MWCAMVRRAHRERSICFALITIALHHLHISVILENIHLTSVVLCYWDTICALYSGIASNVFFCELNEENAANGICKRCKNIYDCLLAGKSEPEVNVQQYFTTSYLSDESICIGVIRWRYRPTFHKYSNAHRNIKYFLIHLEPLLTFDFILLACVTSFLLC